MSKKPKRREVLTSTVGGEELFSILKDIPDDTVFIIGAGHFGRRAARLLNENAGNRIIVVDKNRANLSAVDGLPVTTVQNDGVEFLVEYDDMLKPENLVVPAIPLHLAFEWLKRSVERDYKIKRLPIPEGVRNLIAHHWEGTEGSLLVSYADFMCPDDCEEPEYCTVTGERRREPMHDVLARLRFPEFDVHIVRSLQLAPGLGGYRMRDLRSAAERLSSADRRKWLLGTSCRCHGILTAFEMERRS